MTAETIICIVILLICAVPLIVIGIFQVKSKEPVGFRTGAKCIIPSFFLGMLFGGDEAACAMGVEIIGGLVVMICYHNYLNRKYVG